ncbi:Vps5 C terminal like-domain-containing protein [Suillus clintonianus]|uniref:Vps5 C terminal like-domain-containing protein n=1 Tax=Suillus clintonianus TaxID=1904413 RepID=UPI001B8861F1|nr:Vps5 C terminal like-domain-containing protein [Suillus clintonianus]KAG2128542.1 Vps5 C terminal like-domain-containing protein [Suillus clintonianus]
MDGFDDLLAPSRNVLEENPFEDPFSKRSSSPDPWSSFTHNEPGPTHHDIDYYRTGFEDEPERSTSATPTTASYVTGDRGHSDQNSLSVADPLDAAAVTADSEDHNDGHSTAPTDATSPRKPGFSIYTSSAEDHTTTVSEAKSESPAPDDDKPVRAVTPPHQESSLSFTAALSPTEVPAPFDSPERAAISPLERSFSPVIEQSFASVAVEAESQRGWQSDWGANDPLPPVHSPVVNTTADDEDDDDKPICQSAKFKGIDRINSPQLASSPARSGDSSAPIFVISVDDPQRVGDPIRAFTMYTVHTRTNSPLFQKSIFSVLRRYSDFLWLYETLSTNNPGVVVPPVPEKSPFGRFDETFVQQRRLALEKCIQKIVNHPVLAKDPDLKLFLESDTFSLDIKHRKAEISHERGGLMASIGQTLAGPRFHETDEWFDKQRAYLDGLESQLRGLVKSIEVVAKQRSELAAATGEFATAITDLSLSDIGKQLEQSLAAMADVQHKAEEVQTIQSQQDIMTLLATADEYSRLINSVRLAFNSRMRTYTAWQNADSDVRRVKQNHERLRAQGRLPTDRMSHTVSQVSEAERRALDAKHEFDQCSKLIKSEMARFEQERVDDFKITLQSFLDGMISRQKELIATWENYQQILLKRVAAPDGSKV